MIWWHSATHKWDHNDALLDLILEWLQAGFSDDFCSSSPWSLLKAYSLKECLSYLNALSSPFSVSHSVCLYPFLSFHLMYSSPVFPSIHSTKAAQWSIWPIMTILSGQRWLLSLTHCCESALNSVSLKWVSGRCYSKSCHSEKGNKLEVMLSQLLF